MAVLDGVLDDAQFVGGTIHVWMPHDLIPSRKPFTKDDIGFLDQYLVSQWLIPRTCVVKHVATHLVPVLGMVSYLLCVFVFLSVKGG